MLPWLVALQSVTDTPAEVVWLPPASVARAFTAVMKRWWPPSRR
jgi:hypothetical protein